MAYAFQKIDDALNQNESNIFGGSTEGDDNQMMQQGGQSGVKTSTSGDVGSSPVSSSSTQGVQEYNPPQASNAQVLERNVGKTDVGRGGVSKISDQIQANQQRLEDDANRYRQDVKDASDYSDTVSDSNIESAISGDRDAMDSVSGLLNKGTYYRPEYEAGDYGVSDVDLLNNQAGIQTLAARGQGPRYTSGMGAFDAMLMQRDPEFQNLVSQVRADNRALEQSAEGQPDTLEEWAQGYGEDALTDAQTQAEDMIRNYNANMRAQQEAELKAYQDQIAGLNEQEIQQKAIENVLSSLIPEMEQVSGYSDLRDFAPNIEGDFVGTVDPSQFTYQDFIDEGEAQRFNNIARLLGEGDMYGAGRAPTAEDLYQVDTQGLRDALASGITAGKTEDVNRKIADIQRDIDIARGRNYGSDLVRHYYENVLPEKQAGLAPGRGLMDDGSAMLSPEEVQRLSDYQQIRDRYGDNFESIYNRDLTASDILNMIEGRA